jgi:DNA repair exonuclease SbcCD ATPase subunit
MNLQDTRKQVDKILHEYRTNKTMLKNEKQLLEEQQQTLTYTEEAQTILQSVAQSLQQQAHLQISKVVSQCLQTVFYDEDYGFKIRFEKKRGKTEAKLLLLNAGNEVEDPLNEDSGGVLDVASFALRLACLMLAKPKLRRLLVMDEPFKNVSYEYRVNVKQMLEKLTADFDIQIIMVTHEQGFKCGKVVQL